MNAVRRRAKLRLLWALGTGLLLLGALVLADHVPPGADWWAAHPMTAAAVSTVIGFVAVGLLVEQWIKEREAAQLRLISSVAYRSLAQYVNDAGRSLLAPVVGADLQRLAVPSAADDDLHAIVGRLHRHGLGVTFDQTTGSWRNISAATHGETLRELCTDAEYVQMLFRTAATTRRRLHEATAVWAAVMLTSRWSAEDLGRLRTLTDAMELLQERCRLSDAVRRGGDGWTPDAPWPDAVSADFWSAVTAYETLRDDFAELAELPSDEIVIRRG